MSVVRRFTRGRSITMALHAQSFDRVQQAASFKRHFGQAANITFHQGTDFPAQYDNFGALARTPPPAAQLLLAATHRGRQAAVSGPLVEDPARSCSASATGRHARAALVPVMVGD
jgi:hypothetical protein